MNEQMDDRKTDRQSDSQIVRQTDPEKAAHTLESDTGQAAGHLGTPGFCTTSWSENLFFREV